MKMGIKIVGVAAALLLGTAAAIQAQARWKSGDDGLQSASARNNSTAAQKVDPDAAAKLRKDKADSSLAVLPTVMLGKPFPKVGETIAMMLERGGMTRLELAAEGFVPPSGADLPTIVESLRKHVQTNPPASDFILYTEFRGTPAAGVAETLAVVVDRDGRLAWADRQAKGDSDFDRIKPREPMQACQLVVGRIRSELSLSDPFRAGAPQGKIARRWAQKTGLPDEKETAAMRQRAKVFGKSAGNASMLVMVAGDNSPRKPDASAMAAGINRSKLARAKASDSNPELKITRSMNEQEALWSMAYSFRDHVKKHPPGTDYALYVDVMMRSADKVGAVHFALCDKNGDLVAVDFQNEHHADFKATPPHTAEGAVELVLRRLRNCARQ